MRVIFLRDELYEHLGRNQGHLFREGEKYDFEPTFAERWTRRLIAEEIAGGKPDDGVGTAGPFEPLNTVTPAADAPVSAAAKRAAAGAKPKVAAPAGPRPGSKAAKAAETAAAKPADAPKPVEPPPASAPPPAAAPPAETPPQAQTLPLPPPKPGQAG